MNLSWEIKKITNGSSYILCHLNLYSNSYKYNLNVQHTNTHNPSSKEEGTRRVLYIFAVVYEHLNFRSSVLILQSKNTYFFVLSTKKEKKYLVYCIVFFCTVLLHSFQSRPSSSCSSSTTTSCICCSCWYVRGNELCFQCLQNL